MVSGEVPKEDETMRQEEVVRKNISLVFDFLRYLTDHPEMVEEIPEGCELQRGHSAGARPCSTG